MKYLMIDTSTNLMVLILHQDNKEPDFLYRLGKSDHQAYIITLIDELLKRNKTDLKELKGIIIGVGPGSYTGLRVGVMTAKMLSYSTGIPLYKISSLLFLTSGYKGKVLSWHDARNNNGFSAIYKNGEIIKKELLRNIDALTNEEKEMKVVLNDKTIKIDTNIIFQYKEVVKNIKSLVPNYLRKTEAEAKFD